MKNVVGDGVGEIVTRKCHHEEGGVPQGVP